MGFRKKKSIASFVCFLTVCLVGVFSSEVQADEVKLLRKKDKSKRIPDLVFKRNIFPVKVKGSGVNTQVMATIVGRHDPNLGLIYKGYKIRKRKSDGAFKLTVPVWGPYSPFIISTVTPEGLIVHEKFVLHFRKWKEFKADYVRKKLNFNAGLGITHLSYSQTDKPDFSSIMTTAKVSAFYLLSPGVLDIGLNTFMNVLPITSSRQGFSLKFWGVNGRLGYVLPFVDRPWRVSLMVSYYYITTFISSPAGTDPEDEFGFTNMKGPQFFPLIMRYLDSGDILMAYFKFSPVSNEDSFFSFSNREISGGLGWIMPNKDSSGAWSFHLDIAKLELEFPQTATQNYTAVSAFSISFSAAYGF